MGIVYDHLLSTIEPGILNQFNYEQPLSKKASTVTMWLITYQFLLLVYVAIIVVVFLLEFNYEQPLSKKASTVTMWLITYQFLLLV
jgi:membrane protein YdbS with pleckstrin-like domain